MVGFLNAIQPHAATIILAGRPLDVERATLGLHLLLARVAKEADAALRCCDAGAAAHNVRLYLETAGVGDHCASATGVEMFLAYLRISALNAPILLLPFMRSIKGKTPSSPPYDYEDRGYALWIHKLASCYGWTRHYIMDELYPEEVMAYLQEMMVAEYHEYEAVRVLHEAAWTYDKGAKVMRYRPSPMPAWMAGTHIKPRTFRIHKRMLPMGEVIKLN